MPKITARPATMDDYDAICNLLDQVDRYHVYLLPSVFQDFVGPARPPEQVLAVIESEDADYVLAEQDGAVMGCMHIKKASPMAGPMFKEGGFAMVVDVVVDDRHHGEGIGAALLNKATHWARQRSLASLRLTVYAANRVARRFFQKHGFQTLSEQLEKRLT